MSIRLAGWKPNTCSNPPCEFVYSYDDSLVDIEPSITLTTVVNKCAVHSSLANDAAFLNARADNKRFNAVLREIRSIVPQMFISQADADAENKAKLALISPNIPNRVKTYINGQGSSDLLIELVQETGLKPTIAGGLWPGIDITFTWSGSGSTRLITVSIPIMTTQEKNNINTFFLNNYGGRVIVV